jgi:hypothetical protein
VVALAMSSCGGDADEPRSSGPTSTDGEMRTAEPSYSKTGPLPQIEMVLRNNGSRACSLPTTSDGSVEILSVHRDGTAVLGMTARVDLYSGMAAVVARSLQSVDPGTSITVPIKVEKDDDNSPVVVSTQQTDGDSGRTTTWPLGAPGRYRLIARWSPADGVDRPDLPPMCPPEAGQAAVEFEMTP